MKSFFKFIIGSILSSKARAYLKKHRVQVIAVTGSVGKTSAKEAIYQMLKGRFDVYSSKKSFNTEFGLSLAVLQEEESGFSSPKAWFKIMKRVLLTEKKPYKKIVLEMGADKPGDIKKLIKIAPPKIAVVTNVNPVHMAEGQFSSLEEIAKEKGNLVKHLPKMAVAILNEDDHRVRQMDTSAHIFSFGLDQSAMLRAEAVQASGRELKFGISYKDEYQEFVVPVVGAYQVYVLLPAIAVALQLDMSLAECAQALAHFVLPPGRMNPISGVNGSQIIDGSYNASPVTVKAALEVFSDLKATRKIAALGTMNELGDLNFESHLEVGRQAAKVANLLIFVGKEAPTLKKGALDAGMNEANIFTFFDAKDAGAFMKNNLESGDLILVKGSQNLVRMERFVELIMKEPEKATELLCRQGEAWDKR